MKRKTGGDSKAVWITNKFWNVQKQVHTDVDGTQWKPCQTLTSKDVCVSKRIRLPREPKKELVPWCTPDNLSHTTDGNNVPWYRIKVHFHIDGYDAEVECEYNAQNKGNHANSRARSGVIQMKNARLTFTTEHRELLSALEKLPKSGREYLHLRQKGRVNDCYDFSPY